MRSGLELRPWHSAADLDLIDEALDGLDSSRLDRSGRESDSDSPLSTVLGAALVATGGYQIALRRSDRLEGTWVPEPVESKRTPARGFEAPSRN